MGKSNGNGKHPNGKGTLHVAFVLDESGSMTTIEEAVVEGFNEYLRKLQVDDGETLFSLTTFDTTFQPVCVAEPLSGVSALDHHAYRPGGSTALFDAVGHTVVQTARRLAEQGRSGERVLVVVMTDGLENASTDYDGRSIAELIREYDALPNWTFVYLGAGHDSLADARQTAEQLSFKGENAMRWEHDAASARKSMGSLADATSARRRAASPKSEQFFADAGQAESDYTKR
jgi:uncharacterized protein YegL